MTNQRNLVFDVDDEFFTNLYHVTEEEVDVEIDKYGRDELNVLKQELNDQIYDRKFDTKGLCEECDGIEIDSNNNYIRRYENLLDAIERRYKRDLQKFVELSRI